MAQPVFDEHPLEAYLRQSGDGTEPMPGSMSDSTLEDDALLDDDDDTEVTYEELWGWLPAPVARLFDAFHTVASTTKRLSTSEREFSERFKYDVISSSLLSSSISAPQSARRRSFPLPGDVDLSDSEPDPGKPNSDCSAAPHTTQDFFSASPILLSLTLISLFSGFFTLFIVFGTASYYFCSHSLDGGRKVDAMIPTLNALNELIASGNLWDSAVHEAIAILEREESNLSQGHTSPISPPSSLRVALHTSLHTTQSQADNVRHLLAALTAPASLAQLSEMYAPPSPVKQYFQLGAADRPRSMSPSTVATTRQRTVSAPSQANKRMTWNGNNPFTYSALASAGSPSRQLYKRREKRRSDLSAILSKPPSLSAPTTPNSISPLAGVAEEQTDYIGEQSEADSDAETPHAVPREERSQFATAAFDLQRRRQSGGMEAFGIHNSSPPPSYTTAVKAKAMSRLSRTSAHSSTSSAVSASSPMSSYSSSRFTSMQTNRHPLSLSALHLAIQGAVAAKRYAASHLLALRFEEVDVEDWRDDDEAYWEDVRAVMALLTSTLADAAARLTQALDHAEGERLRDQNPTPNPMPSSPLSRPNSPTAGGPSHGSSQGRSRYSHLRTVSEMTSFAPMPSHFSRFAAHVDAMSSSLNDARDHLEECIASLRDGDASASPSPEESPAMQAYERLRRELGLALRECERGRERLLDLVAPPPPAGAGDDEDDMPALGPDGESDESESPTRPTHQPISPTASAVALSSPDAVLVHGAPGPAVHDDATLQLLLSTSTQHLPPQGIEQVFEADPESLKGSYVRERSKLTREERIKLAKARRESGQGIGLGLSIGPGDKSARGKGGVERWGPGGDVVQELKDVIWKVGEKRRKMAEGRTPVDGGRAREGTAADLPSYAAEQQPGLELEAGITADNS